MRIPLIKHIHEINANRNFKKASKYLPNPDLEKKISLSFFDESHNKLILSYAKEFRNLQEITLSKQRPSALKLKLYYFSIIMN
jgi:hypothetical protein